MATTMDSGPLDDLVALHDELGVFEALDGIPVDRQRRGDDCAWTLVSTRDWPSDSATVVL